MTSRKHQILIVRRGVCAKEGEEGERKEIARDCEKESYIKCVQIAESCRCKDTQTKYKINIWLEKDIFTMLEKSGTRP